MNEKLKELWLKFRVTRECEITDCGMCSIDFAQQVLAEERKEIADEIYRIYTTHGESLSDYIDELRS
jgi:hypothetical protein